MTRRPASPDGELLILGFGVAARGIFLARPEPLLPQAGGQEADRRKGHDPAPTERSADLDPDRQELRVEPAGMAARRELAPRPLDIAQPRDPTRHGRDDRDEQK